MTAMIPKSRPAWDRSKVAQIVLSHEVKADLCLLGVRGYFRDSMGIVGLNDRAIYDDAMFVYSPKAFKSFNANVDPGVVRKGVATLKTGLYFYQRGLHGYSSGHPYPALRQASDVTVIRDGGKEETDSVNNRFWINIHRGGYTKTSSLGCQTIYPDQYDEFLKLVYSQMDAFDQPRLPYLLIEAQG